MLNSRLLLYDCCLLCYSFRNFALFSVSILIIFYMVSVRWTAKKRVKSVACKHECACQVMQKLNNKSSITAITTLATICNYTHEKKESMNFDAKKIMPFNIRIQISLGIFTQYYNIFCHVSLKKHDANGLM